jgi:hypothetical protein
MKLLIILLIIITVIIFIYYKFFIHEYTNLFDDVIVLNNNFNKQISNLYLPESKNGIEFSYTFWIYFKNIPENANLLKYNYKKNKFIFGIHNSPGFYYNIINNQLIMNIKYNTKSYSVNINDLKLQKWNHIAIVLNNRELSIYIDSKLYKTTLIPSVPFIYNRDLNIGEKNNNFNGLLADGRYYNKALSQKKITTIYSNYKFNK